MIPAADRDEPVKRIPGLTLFTFSRAMATLSLRRVNVRGRWSLFPNTVLTPGRREHYVWK